MIWDTVDRRYEDENGRPLSPAEIHAYIEDYIASEKAQVRSQSERLFNQEITVQEFFIFMRRKVTAWHGVAGVIAYGGEAQMNG